MTLIPNWKTVLTRAWSVRFMAAALFFEALNAFLGEIAQALMLPDETFRTLSVLSVAGAMLARFLDQNLPKTDAPRPALSPAEALLVDANEALRSAYQIARREGTATNWAAFRLRLDQALQDQHALVNELREREAGDAQAR